ncbi:STIP1 homology and U box-containing protein 1 [Seminavis robusta]|uniref:STIP1 homology and U box-containing protein 1 n=1 Tax=Seminavis robusta TaxID=568900 RepID=A0A9N8DJH7_9STRA|nr:STIP1 homology and U box-containing protein 1 [Seminavis robusta]|eukprot:Sro162_g072800.1 STIP1 homology and U box-containing protein 1 (413) ;mRNA; f:28231-29563
MTATTTKNNTTVGSTTANTADEENQLKTLDSEPNDNQLKPGGAFPEEDSAPNEEPDIMVVALADDGEEADDGVAETATKDERKQDENPSDETHFADEQDPELKFPFPKAFHDPISNKIMVDPVVLPDGNSYEKEDVISRANGEIHYPNRALKAYIEAELDRYGDAGTVRAAVQQWGESLRSGWQRLIENSPLPAGEERTLPTAFYGPITFELLQEPVIDPDGHSYEKAAIYQWIQANGDSPVTRKPLTIEQLYDNNALLNVMEELSDENGPQPVSACMRRWKEEHLNHTPTPPPDPTAPQASNIESSNHGPTMPNPQYPTTREDLEALQRLRNQKHATLFGILVICLLIFFFAPSYFLCFLMILVAASIVYAPQMARHRQLEDRRREIIAEAYRRQQRQQQRRQQQQPQAAP